MAFAVWSNPSAARLVSGRRAWSRLIALASGLSLYQGEPETIGVSNFGTAGCSQHLLRAPAATPPRWRRPSGFAQFTRHLRRRPVDAGGQPRVEFWVGREIQLRARKHMDHGCDHEVSHVPSIAAEERGLDELLLKNGKPGAERLIGLIGQGLAPLLRRKEDPVPEQCGQCQFDVVRNEERPLQHSTAALRRRWEERVLVLLGEVEI
jgi:hypothetical protein